MLLISTNFPWGDETDISSRILTILFKISAMPSRLFEVKKPWDSSLWEKSVIALFL